MTHKTHTTLDPTRLGTVEDVSGSSVSVKLADDTAHGLLFVKGEGYRVGQVGSFVRVPAGYVDLFGIVSQVGAGAAPGPPELAPQLGNRWLRVELVGEGRRGAKFERGISQYPSIGDSVHVVTESDLRTIYAPGDEDAYVAVGRVASAESIRAYLDLNRLVSRHSAVLGSTGAGKSTAVATLLAAVSDQSRFPAARVVLLDIHGEYAKAFGDRARVLRINPNATKGELALHVPFWALRLEECVNLTTGPVSGGAGAHLHEAIVALKRLSRPGGSPHGFADADITVDTPLPFCIHKLWFDLHCLQYATHTAKPSENQSPSSRAYETDGQGKAVDRGDAMNVRRPRFRATKNESNNDDKIYKSSSADLMRSQTDTLEGKLRDPRLSFLFRPGPWAVAEDGTTGEDLDTLVAQWLGRDKPITVLDLSGIPPTVLDDLVGVVLRIIFEALFWGRALTEGGQHRPVLIALEEAHNYLGSNSKSRAADAARRIAKEGRKYGVGLMLVSQRPSEVDPTILSQCGTMVALRLTNEADRGQVSKCASDNLKGLFSMLPTLRTGEALIVGEAVNMPIRALIDLPPPERRPDSEDPAVVVPLGQDGQRIRPGGWTEAVESEDYKPLVMAWRKQDPHAGETPPPSDGKKTSTEKG